MLFSSKADELARRGYALLSKLHTISDKTPMSEKNRINNEIIVNTNKDELVAIEESMIFEEAMGI